MKRIHKLLACILIFSLCFSTSSVIWSSFSLTANAELTTGYYKSTKELNLRSEASSSASLIYTDATNTVAVKMPIGTNLLVTELSNGYGKAYFQGFEGWVNLSDCEYIRAFVTPSDASSAVLDISKFQDPSNFDWEKIKASGITGVILRLGGRLARNDGTGDLYEDTAVLQHYADAKAVGMNIGFYFFSFANTREGAVEEAQFCIDMITENELVADLPIFMDLEDYSTISMHYNGGKTLNNMLVNAFCSTLENAGYYAGLYTNYNFITNVVDPSVLTNRAFWYAQYSSTASYEGRYDLWQYTASGTVDGYSESRSLDLNYCYRDFPTFIKQYGFNGFEGNNTTGSDGHVHQYASPVAEKQASCTTDGLQSISCATCSELLQTEIVKKTAHDKTQVFVPNNIIDYKANDKFTLSSTQYYDLSDENSTLSAFNALQSTGGTLLSYCNDCKLILSVQHFSDSAGCSHEYSMNPSVYTANSTMNIRTGPATSFSAVKNASGKTVYASSGSTFNVYYTLGDWGYANYNSIYGWINLQYSTLSQQVAYNNATTIQHPGCISEGVQSVSCSKCAAVTYKENIPAQGHIKGAYVHNNGTCLTNGNYTSHCQVCNTLINYKIAELGNHIYTQTIVKNPTINSMGSATYTCSVCEDTHKIQLRSLNMFDADASGDCNSGDARLALRCSVGLETLTKEILNCLDVNHDDLLTSGDARLLLRLSVELENKYDLLFQYYEVE